MNIDELLRDQAGVVARTQVLDLGHDDGYVARKVRRREWSRVHRGVYVDHTGEPTPLQRAWAAVLYFAPAALCGDTVLELTGVHPARPGALLHVAVSHERRVARLPNVKVHRMRHLHRVVQPARLPPQVRLEHAALQAASSRQREDDVVAVLADACRSRRTTATRLNEALHALPRLPRRGLISSVLADVASGVQSPLEQRYLARVERAHGLPTAQRQSRVATGDQVAYRDVEYLGGRVVVELDGRLGHDLGAERRRDLDRDLANAVAGTTTIRLGWGQVLDPCRTALGVGGVLMAAGWRGRIRSCGSQCEVLLAA